MRGALYLAAAAATAVTIVFAPLQLREVWRDVRNAAAQTRLERELAPATQVGIERPDVFVVADRVIPLDATYAVVTGADAPLREPRSRDYVPIFAFYWLMPRRRVEGPSQADWIVGYGGQYQARVGRVVEVGPGISVAEVRG